MSELPFFERIKGGVQKNTEHEDHTNQMSGDHPIDIVISCCKWKQNCQYLCFLNPFADNP